jgi:hypothetical protein
MTANFMDTVNELIEYSEANESSGKEGKERDRLTKLNDIITKLTSEEPILNLSEVCFIFQMKYHLSP